MSRGTTDGPKLRCWPGCLAIIVGGDEFGPFLTAGRIVQCIRLVEKDWWDIGCKLHDRHTGRVRDRVLRPITPPDDAQDTTADTPADAVAA